MSAFSPTVVGDSSSRFKIIIVEESPMVTYIGKASPGSLTTAAAWNIQRITNSEKSQVIEWAEGRPFSNIWDNYKTLSYS